MAEYQALLDEVWREGWLTNHGPMVRRFEAAIGKYLGLPFVSFVSSGTMALQCAMRLLPRGGEVITTPYSYVATAGAAFWEGFTPVFADIEEERMGIDPALVAAKITPRTRAILATHVYGVPAAIEGLEEVAKAHKLPLYFDGAHCFGAKYQGKSLLAFGDLSVLSTHATKLFHTANGGLVVSPNAETKSRIDGFRNFGHDGPNHFVSPGINGKNSELHAALGLANLAHADALLERRTYQWERYRQLLDALPDRHFLHIPEGADHNGAYFPILRLTAREASRTIDALLSEGVEARRYFNPALNTIAYMRGGPCPVAEAVAETVFCLPLHHELTEEAQGHVAEIILKNL